MTPAHVSTAFFTVAAPVLAGLILVAVRLVMEKSVANLCIAGFLAFVIPSPMMLVVHPRAAIVMAGLGLACLVPAVVLAEDHDDDGRGGGGGGGPDPVGPEPDPGWGPDLWDDFERDFWSHIERTRELVNA